MLLKILILFQIDTTVSDSNDVANQTTSGSGGGTNNNVTEDESNDFVIVTKKQQQQGQNKANKSVDIKSFANVHSNTNNSIADNINGKQQATANDLYRSFNIDNSSKSHSRSKTNCFL